MLQQYHSLPDLVRDVVINPEKSPFSFVKPIARQNEVANPSLELATTNYTAGAGTLTRSTEKQYHGAYSAKYVPSAAVNDGFYYGTISMTSGEVRAVSCKFWGAPNVPYKLSVATTGGVDLAVKKFRGQGRWQWVWVFWKETSTNSRRIYFTKDNSTSVATFYVDGVQSEVCAAGEVFPTTYIDGDQTSLLVFGQFPPPYGWNGSPHASTSYRSANTRDGGRVMSLDFFRFILTGIMGLGLAMPGHIAASQGYVDGSTYLTSIIPSREFSLEGRLAADTDYELRTRRAELGEVLGLSRTAPRQPVVLLYQEHRGLEPMGAVGKIVASYKRGLEGRWDSQGGENVTLPFVQWFPFIETHDAGAALTQSLALTVTNISNLMFRNADGTWSKLADFTLTVSVLDAVQHPDGSWYVCGNFTSIGGVSANGIARYDPVTGTFSALGTGLSNQGNKLFIDPQGNVYVGGNFTTANGVTVNHITYWNGTTFVALGSGGTKGVNNTVIGVTMDSSGNLYVTGQFTQAGGGAAAAIAKLTPAGTWSALGTGLTGGAGFGFALATALNGTDIYVGGAFTTANGVLVNYVAKWNGTTFEDLGGGMNTDVRDLLITPNGDLYAGGDFSTSGGTTTNMVARWNGAQWTSLGSGIVGTFVSDIRQGFDGFLYAGGAAFTSIGGVTPSDSFGLWNGSSWGLPDIDVAGAAQVSAFGVGRRGELMVNFFNGTASNATASVVNVLTNNGTCEVYPVITIVGPSSSTSRLHHMRSYTSNQILSFDLTIFANERITISLGPDIVTIQSTTRGNLSDKVLPGSSIALNLLPGSNRFALLITGGTVTATIVWKERCTDASDLVKVP